MITYKCKNCGGQMDFGGAGGFVCPFCGSKAFMSDADFKGNEAFRKKLLQYYKAEALKKENDYSVDRFWSCEGRDGYSLENGETLTVDYMIKTECDGYVCYLAQRSVVYIFEKSAEAGAFLAGLGKLSFPAADAKLHRSVPELTLKLDLKEGKQALVFRRRPNFYPAEYFAPWTSSQLAWVISRMENVCCLLKFSELEHGGIEPGSVWVNPLSHEGALFGDWRGVRQLRGRGDLISLRKTAIALAENTREPAELYRFLNSEPASDAFLDFEKWDTVIDKGFGGHKFEKNY